MIVRPLAIELSTKKRLVTAGAHNRISRSDLEADIFRYDLSLAGILTARSSIVGMPLASVILAPRTVESWP
jgi:hypothetical protein